MILPKQALRVLLDYHYSRRERVYDFLETIKPEEFTRRQETGWGSIRNALVHSLEAEEFWVQHGIQKQSRPDFDFDAYPDVASLRRLAAEVRERTETFFAALTEADLAGEASITFSSGAGTSFTVAKALTHIILHDTHHRGQVWALVRGMGYEPPEIDLM